MTQIKKTLFEKYVAFQVLTVHRILKLNKYKYYKFHTRLYCTIKRRWSTKTYGNYIFWKLTALGLENFECSTCTYYDGLVLYFCQSLPHLSTGFL